MSTPAATHQIPKLELPRERFELRCGAKLIVSRRPGAPVTAARAHIRGGPSLDPVDRAGEAYLVGSLIDQGTQKHDEQALSALLEPNGGEVGGDANGISGTIAGVSWKLLLETLAELLVTPTYPDEAVGRQKRRLLSRLHVERDDPRTQGRRLFQKLVYGDHWLGRAAYGSLESVERIEPAHLREHHAQTWVASRCVIGVCGDVDPEQVRKLLDKSLAKWTPGEPFDPAPPKFPGRAARLGVFSAPREQVHVYLGHLGIKRNDPDYAPLVVMDHVLGTGPGFTNRICRILRDEQGLAYSVSADIHSSAGLLPGMFTAYIGTSPEKVSTAVQGFMHEIRRIRDEPVEQAELEVAKSYLLGSFALGFERASRRASTLVAAELHGFPDDELERLVACFAAVTAEDVQRAARKHLFPDDCCVAAAGPIKEKELRAIIAAPKRRKK